MARKLHSYTDLRKRISEDGQYRTYYYWDNFANKAVDRSTSLSNLLTCVMAIGRIYIFDKNNYSVKWIFESSRVQHHLKGYYDKKIGILRPGNWM